MNGDAIEPFYADKRLVMVVTSNPQDPMVKLMVQHLELNNLPTACISWKQARESLLKGTDSFLGIVVLDEEHEQQLLELIPEEFDDYLCLLTQATPEELTEMAQKILSQDFGDNDGTLLSAELSPEDKALVKEELAERGEECSANDLHECIVLPPEFDDFMEQVMKRQKELG